MVSTSLTGRAHELNAEENVEKLGRIATRQVLEFVPSPFQLCVREAAAHHYPDGTVVV
jgi:hypothetical protein